MNKRIQIIALVLVMLSAITACLPGKSTTIVNKTDNLTQKIKYSGKIVFTLDKTAIEHISDGGYLEFEENGEGFTASSDSHGKVAYEFNNDGKVNELNEGQKQFLAHAVNIIVKEQQKLKPGNNQ
ncbi:hypothetical protein GWR56_12100 [Mucilaginibacter sp. 14171R-50]|uniref:hypothetical protein n=1 Tax=Mucilaginibacter sp. 14171R-50 TaxID=2703789 RepID=UPI00138DC99B|nr:hypothetical protein [Mucilaginibacter sp. 14171R-50]QHS56240.1 hypothetical protein GWR56_12100 [Mucilaginibacter sp. 14171R-50]